MPEATRVHLEPTINLPWSNDWASLNTEAKLMATHYQQKISIITMPVEMPTLRSRSTERFRSSKWTGS